MQLELVLELGGVAPQEYQPHGQRVASDLLGVRDAEARLEPGWMRCHPLDQEGERLRDRVVAEAAVLELEPGVGVGVMLDVASLVKQAFVVAVPPDR